MKTYKINKYKAFTNFKKNVGYNNQFIITALICLNLIHENDIKEEIKPAPWNPKDVNAAVEQSRLFVQKAGLVWVISLLDVLLDDFFKSFFSQEDKFIKDNNGRTKVKNKEDNKSKAGDRTSEDYYSYDRVVRSVYLKYSVVSDLLLMDKDKVKEYRNLSDFRNLKNEKYLPDLELVLSLMDLAIQWRNTLVHGDIKNSILNDTKRILKANKDTLADFKKGYGCLDYSIMLERYNKGDAPSFKEVSTLIRNTIDFAYILNAYWIHSVDKEKLLEDKLRELFKKSPDNIIYKTIYPFDNERRLNYVIQSLNSHMISLKKEEDEIVSKEEQLIKDYLKGIFKNYNKDGFYNI